jgi:hypothetical protein
VGLGAKSVKDGIEDLHDARDAFAHARELTEGECTENDK